MKAVRLLLLSAMAGSLASLSTGCTAIQGPNSPVSLMLPSAAATPRTQSDQDQDFYQPPRDPQFNTARDQ